MRRGPADHLVLPKLEPTIIQPSNWISDLGVQVVDHDVRRLLQEYRVGLVTNILVEYDLGVGVDQCLKRENKMLQPAVDEEEELEGF